MNDRVVGLDLSLTSTGVACITSGPEAPWVERITSEPEGKKPTLNDRRLRIAGIRLRVLQLVGDPRLVVVEQPAFSRTTGQQHDRSGLWWTIVDALGRNGIPVAEVSPTTLKRYALGKGSGKGTDKDKVLAAVVRRYLDVDVTGNDEADGLVLAAMGARALGYPIEASLPKTHIDALMGVRWPEDIAARLLEPYEVVVEGRVE
jgi:crossover junction endodeoxyribonuclease RuvC